MLRLGSWRPWRIGAGSDMGGIMLNKKSALLEALVLVLVFSAFLPLSSADSGMVPWPPEVHLKEAGQKAIVAWNGAEEVLILSTDVRSTGPATVLRLVPLPSNPTKVKEGSFSSFENIVNIINEKIRAGWEELAPTAGREGGGPPPLEITFHAKLGPHDVTIVKVNNLEYFMTWVENFAQSRGLVARALPANFEGSVENYLDRGISYFVFDIIETSASAKSYTPLVYRFKTDFLYYPLVITGNSVGLESSWDEIQLFIITKGRIRGETVEKIRLEAGAGFEEWLELDQEELTRIDTEIAALFESDPFVMNSSYSGQLADLKEDLIVSQEEIHIPSTFDRFIHGLSVYAERNFILQYIQELSKEGEYDLLEWLFIVFLLGALLCGIPTSILLIGKLTDKTLKRFIRREFPVKVYYEIAVIVVILLILFSNILAIAIFALSLFTVVGIAGIILLIRRIVRFLEH